MKRLIPILVAVAFSLAATGGPPASAALADATGSAAEPSLTLTPDMNYLAGQSLLWTGNIGVNGVRTIAMERNLGRPGDAWELVEYFHDQTDANGNFAYPYPAPSMRSIAYRVVSDTYVTPSVVIEAVQQELIMWVTGVNPDDPTDIGPAVAGVPFAISVDTTPKLFKRPDTVGVQPIPGRVLTLQRRVVDTGDEWTTLDTTVEDAFGMGQFIGVTEPDPGEVVYRVRQEDWTQDGNQIGWDPSFPTYVTISAPGPDSVPAMAAPVAPSSETGAEFVGPEYDPSKTAAQLYKWAPNRFDFGWVLGESLTSPPWRGTLKKGWWLDYSDGGGRTSKDGGGIVLDSKRVNDAGPGDFGTTKATLQENPLKYGRWETKLWPTAGESDGEDYQLRLELVPDGAQNDACRTITVADFTAHGDTVNFGVNAVTKKWTGSTVVGPLDDRIMAFAVEINTDHITWFLDGEPIGTVTQRKAFPKVPMTLRLSMIGNGAQEMNRTELKSDWQRGYTLDRGEQVTTGAPLTRRVLGSC